MDETGSRYGKANADLDMAVDALLQSENLDQGALRHGDGDFVQVVKALQNKGCRVRSGGVPEHIQQPQREVDLFMSGYLIPNPSRWIIPKTRNGESGLQRCAAYATISTTRNYGFVRFLPYGPGLWITDTRQSESPYNTAFVQQSTSSWWAS